VNSALELHDSNISEIRQQGNDVVVLFSRAYIHKSTGRPGWDAGSGWSQAAEVVVINSMLPHTLPDNLSDLRGGHLKVNDELFAGLIPMPFNAIGKTELEIEFSEGERLSFVGEGITLFPRGEGQYIEEFAPTSKKR
jgi:hypothetical protein